MTKSNLAKCALAAMTLGCGVVVSVPSIAQYGAPIRLPQGSFNPNSARNTITLAPALANCGHGGMGATMGPCRGPVGTPIQVQLTQNVGAMPVILSFKAVVANGVPARVHTRLAGGGASYRTAAPIQLCMQGGGTWEAELVLANGRNLGVIGSFTPTNCPR